jgi:hypothetical protein
MIEVEKRTVVDANGMTVTYRVILNRHVNDPISIHDTAKEANAAAFTLATAKGITTLSLAFS